MYFALSHYFSSPLITNGLSRCVQNCPYFFQSWGFGVGSENRFCTRWADHDPAFVVEEILAAQTGNLVGMRGHAQSPAGQVEVVNTGSTTVDLSGWTVMDGDPVGHASETTPLPAGTRAASSCGTTASSSRPGDRRWCRCAKPCRGSTTSASLRHWCNPNTGCTCWLGNCSRSDVRLSLTVPVIGIRPVGAQPSLQARECMALCAAK